MKVLFTTLVAVILAGCAGHEAVPVIDRGASVVESAPVVKPSVAVPVAGEGVYIVKKGDTLYKISLDHGQDYKDVAAWNKLENPNRIEVGQQLRVLPPEEENAVAVVKPIVSSAPVETKAAGANTETFKREPKGGKEPYSEETLARMRRGETNSPAPAAEKPAEKPVEKPLEKPATPAPVGDDAIDWAWPAPGKPAATFVEGGAGANKGIDIAGKLGEPVLAAAEGKVVYVGSGLRGYGNLVIVKHNASYLSAYAHNSKILVKESQAVTRGQKIAEIGSSDADQVKLHFEIRHLGKPVDPLKFLPTR